MGDAQPDPPALADRLAALSPQRRAALLRILAPDRAEHLSDPAGTDARPTGLSELSYGQQRMWFLHQLDPASPVHNTITQVPLPPPADLRALRWATNQVIARHEPLRTRYRTVDDDPRADIDPPGAAEVDIEMNPDPTEFVRRPFDLSTGPVVRVCVLQDRDLALLCVHHIATDGWSMRNFVRELARLYRARIDRSVPRLPELPRRYTDFTDWQRRTLRGPNLARLQTFWRDELAGAQPLELPTDRPRPDAPQFRGDAIPVEFPAAIVSALRELARQSGATMFMVVLAAYAVLLGQWSGQADITVGTPVAGRSRSEFEPLIGLFVNTLVIRCDTGGDPTFRELVGRVKDTALRAFAHQELPFQLLVEELGLPRDLTRNPLVQTMLRVETVAPGPAGRAARPSNGPARTVDWKRGTSELDISLDLWDTGGTLSGHLEYSADLFDRGTAQRLTAELVRVVCAVATASDAPLGLLAAAGEQDRAAVRRWNGTRLPLPDLTVTELIDARARAVPGAIAVGDVSYRELICRANLLAHHLVSRGVRPGDVIGLTLRRGADLIVAMLGTWKAGAGYACLDPADPPARRQMLLATVQPAVVLDALPDLWPGNGAPAAGDRPPEVMTRPDSLAYAVFTSGTTGSPKVVRIGHRGLLNHCQGFARVADLGATDRVLQFAPPMFDVAAEEIFPTLATGGTVIPLAGQCVPGISELHDLLASERVSVVNLPAGYWHEWAAAVGQGVTEVPPSLRLVVVGSERIDPDQVGRWRSGVGDRPALLHAYGVSEATITSLVHRIDGGPVVLGRPLPNVQVHVVDRHGTELPIGSPGELVISGPGVALGYLGRPDLDTAAFGTWNGERCYRTGDRARWRPDGTVEFLGRLDRQIKLDGRRVEPGEIESTCARYPGVRAAAVGLADGHLVCAVVGEVTVEDLADHLRARLPSALVPTIHLVKTLPRNANGKVDVTSLRPVRDGRNSPSARSVGTVERQIQDVWRDVLAVDEVGIDDNFFDLGGRSLLLVRVQARLAARGIDASMLDLFRWPTIRLLAAHRPGTVDEY